MLHLRTEMRGVGAARETIRAHGPDRVLGWVVVLSGSQVATWNYTAATATTSFTGAAVPVAPAGFPRSPQRWLWRESVLPGGSAAYNLMLDWLRGNRPLVQVDRLGGATATSSPATLPAGSGRRSPYATRSAHSGVSRLESKQQPGKPTGRLNRRDRVIKPFG
jgi:hypothetical protein